MRMSVLFFHPFNQITKNNQQLLDRYKVVEEKLKHAKYLELKLEEQQMVRNGKCFQLSGPGCLKVSELMLDYIPILDLFINFARYF